MELQVTHSVRTEISKEGIFWGEADRNPRDTAAIVPMERGRNNRRRSMPRPYTSAVKYSAENKCKQLHGVSKREKQPDDIPKVWKHEVCIQEPGILVQGILCRYCWKKHKSNTGVYPKSVENRSGE